MKIAKRILACVLAVIMAFSVVSICAAAEGEGAYAVPAQLQEELQKVYSKYNFAVGWGLYDISGQNLKKVAAVNDTKSFQSNCTIKAIFAMYICTLMDQGELELDTPIYIDAAKLHYKDPRIPTGEYTVRTLLGNMIYYSNNVPYEALLRHVTKEGFNSFLAGIGSGTRAKSYDFMGNCTVRDRALEWFTIYNYCHSKASHASFLWKQFKKAKYSPIRDGLNKKVAHKVGWFYEDGLFGTAGDCAIVKTKNGGCYLMVIFTRNNVREKYSEELISELAVVLDKIWNDYYGTIPQKDRKNMKF